MKTKMIVFILLFFPLYLIAQEKNPLQKDEKEWKFAAGVTLLSNRDYTDYVQKRSPLELNLKYRISGNHFVSASGIISLKNDVHRYPEEFYPNKNMDIKTYLEIIRSNNYSEIVVVDNYYDLYGGAIGYNYSYPIWQKLSLFAGAELGYYRQHWIDKNFQNHYSDDDGQLYLNAVFFDSGELMYNIFSFKPEAGLQYKFKNLLAEASIGYPYSFVHRRGFEDNYSWNGGDVIGHATKPDHVTKLNYQFNEFVVKVALYYLF